MGALLIRPAGYPGPESYLSPPVGLLLVAGALEQAGVDCAIIDLALASDERDGIRVAVSAAIACRPEFIGLSLQSATLTSGIAIARALRNAVPHTPIVAGGPAAMDSADRLAGRPEFDIIVAGWGEPAVGALLPAVAERRIPAVIASSLTGLESVPPAYHLLDLEPYRHGPGGLTILVECARGCSDACLVCASCPGKGAPAMVRSPRDVAAEMNEIWGRLRPDRLMLINLFSLTAKHIFELCRLIEGRKLDWFTHVRIGDLTPDIIGHLSGAGCRSLLIEGQSGPPHKPGEPYTAPRAEDVLTVSGLLTASGIDSAVYLPCGCSNDSRAGLSERIDLAARLTLSGHRALLPLRGCVSDNQPVCRVNISDATAVCGHPAPDVAELIDADPGLFWPYFVPDRPDLPASLHSLVHALGPEAAVSRPATLLAVCAAGGEQTLTFLEEIARTRPDLLIGPSPPDWRQVAEAIDETVAVRFQDSWLVELAAYEAQLCREYDDSLSAASRPALAPGTGLGAYSCDVVDLLRRVRSGDVISPPEPAPCYVVTVNRGGRTSAYRVTGELFTLLERMAAGEPAADLPAGMMERLISAGIVDSGEVSSL